MSNVLTVNKLAFTILIVLAAFDVWSTNLVVIQMGGQEINGFASVFITRYGLAGIVGLKIAALTMVAIILYLLPPDWRKIGWTAAITVSLLPLFWNGIQMVVS